MEEQRGLFWDIPHRWIDPISATGRVSSIRAALQVKVSHRTPRGRTGFEKMERLWQRKTQHGEFIDRQ